MDISSLREAGGDRRLFNIFCIISLAKCHITRALGPCRCDWTTLKMRKLMNSRREVVRVSNQRLVRNRQRTTIQAGRYNQNRPLVNMRNFDCLPHAGPRRRCAAQLSTYTTSPHRHLHTKCTVACRERIARMRSRLVYATMQMGRTNGSEVKTSANVQRAIQSPFLLLSPCSVSHCG